MNRWQRVYFDLDNTLFDYEYAFELASKATLEEWLKTPLDTELTPDHWFIHFKSACDRLWDDYASGELTRGEYQVQRLQQAFNEVDITISDREASLFESQFKKVLPKFATLSNGVAPLLNDLSRSGIEIGIITNGSYVRQISKVKLLHLDQWIPIENIYVTQHPQYVKPSQVMFDYASQKSKKGHSVYIGDSYDLDITGAQNAGWDSILITKNDRSLHFPNHPPTYTIASMEELYELRLQIFT